MGSVVTYLTCSGACRTRRSFSAERADVLSANGGAKSPILGPFLAIFGLHGAMERHVGPILAINVENPAQKKVRIKSLTFAATGRFRPGKYCTQEMRGQQKWQRGDTC